MPSPSKNARAPWPTEVLVGGLSVALGKRAINMDPEDVADCDDKSLLNDSTVVGSMEGSAMAWTQGPIATTKPRAPITSETAEAALRKGASLFLVRGSNYRLYAPDPAAVEDASAPPATEATTASSGEADEPAPAPADAADEPTGSHKSRNAKQYTQAVAFEFVSGVLGNVIGDEAAEEAWQADA